MLKFFFKTCLLMVLTGMLAELPAQESPHKNMQLDCETCHSPESWKSVEFDHNQTGFLLQGQHYKRNCQDCHTLTDFSKVEAACSSCHTDVHQARLGTNCENCHVPVSWSVFDPLQAHANTTFPLIGKHARLDCASCHYREIEGEFLRLSSDCVSCHRDEYQTTTNPVHTDIGFGVRCEDCHSLFSWQPAFFSAHDGYFPIFSGEHSGAWDSCADCHLVQGNYTEFSCLDCHKHRKTKMDDEHREESGYEYDSQACYNCHPRGTKGD